MFVSMCPCIFPGVYNINQISVTALRGQDSLPQLIKSTALLRVDAL